MHGLIGRQHPRLFSAHSDAYEGVRPADPVHAEPSVTVRGTRWAVTVAGTPLPMPLLEGGRLRAGDRLIHHRPRRNRTFTAEVTEDGYIRLENGSEFVKPSPALRACVGNEVNGWSQ